MQNNLLKVAITKHVAVVTLDNPPVNAQSREFAEELIEVFDELNDLPEVRVIVLTGAGKVFSAGADIKSRGQVGAMPGDTNRHLRRTREVGFCIMESSKPVIAAVNGPALGAGLGLVLCCDIILASENAVFGLPEIDIGLMGGVRHTMRLFPHSLTRRMVLSGYRVTAQELYRRGIIEACTGREGLMDEALSIANEIASKSPMALKLAKRAINTVETMGLKDGYRFEQNLTVEMTRHEDSKEAMRAFLEKRPPVFKESI
ncbi:MULTISPECIES: enoyl-CoA hydratase/isomerase family protein [Pseudomonas]|jgi:enoyl-CoA hydratase|uniref:Enoyl-CoA hydratase n=1 Tax=Pseudomonas putida (strain DOT-T1E) TaxID=1196325 RepID=I7CHA2_PSEPT|nr:MULTISPECIES: enoyl-CoA hydratase/isomerase family protein [Pseudomonas]HBK48166.1 enoyl-CoA hydratase [Pseudomonas sp.]ADR60066.1 Enoyl-CoA hydratase [Pseudomonas putida BIRD-1]AFO51259.1 enoyl-CoA hydratase [Pseudomonas putida DOT-T1E]AOX09465.1 enoyl-CoA hydratase [Pseudomonas putida JB]AYN10736.1 enoyl-CoA hydratase [Pseudomonas putida]